MRCTGLRGAYGLLYFVSAYYLIFDRPLVAQSLPYIRRRFPGHGRLQQLFSLYLLFVSQGKCLLDRFAMAAGYDGIGVEIEGYDALRQLLDGSDRGLIMVTAHVGSWQVAMASLKKMDRDVRLMMRPEDNEALRESLDLYGGDERVQVILTSGALGGVVEAMKAIDEGAIVILMGDRPYDFPAVSASFLGGEARFPYGAFTLATAARCPVVVLLSAKVAADRYVVDVSNRIHIPANARLLRGEGAAAQVRQYVGILERYVERFPFQWFVFRDLWTEDGAPEA